MFIKCAQNYQLPIKCSQYCQNFAQNAHILIKIHKQDVGLCASAPLCNPQQNCSANHYNLQSHTHTFCLPVPFNSVATLKYTHVVAIYGGTRSLLIFPKRMSKITKGTGVDLGKDVHPPLPIFSKIILFSNGIQGSREMHPHDAPVRNGTPSIAKSWIRPCDNQ